MSEDICVVIQGQTNSRIVDIRKAWNKYLPNVVFSTWKGDPNLSLYEKSDCVLLNDVPHNPCFGNLNLQKISTLAGIRFAKEKGFSRVLKIRSDMLPVDSDKFMNMFKDEHNFYLFSWINHRDGYYTDYFMCGDTQSMECVWDFDVENTEYDYPEQVLSKNIKALNKNIVECYHQMNNSNDIFRCKQNDFLKITFNPH